MKKNLFYTVMMMAVMAVVAVSFTACGGDDSDDPLNTPTENKQDPDDISVYIWPSTQWGCSLSDLKNYMASSSMVISEDLGDGLIYKTMDNKYLIAYTTDADGKYRLFQSVYQGCTQKKLTNIINKFKKDYNITLEDKGYGEVWRATGAINNKNCEAKVLCEKTTNSIIVEVFVLN